VGLFDYTLEYQVLFKGVLVCIAYRRDHELLLCYPLDYFRVFVLIFCFRESH
jgi:hypothetical protein